MLMQSKPMTQLAARKKMISQRGVAALNGFTILLEIGRECGDVRLG
jgi:hypothetical protein